MGAHERLIEPRVTIKWLPAKRNSHSDLPAFLGPDYMIKYHKKINLGPMKTGEN